MEFQIQVSRILSGLKCNILSDFHILVKNGKV